MGAQVVIRSISKLFSYKKLYNNPTKFIWSGNMAWGIYFSNFLPIVLSICELLLWNLRPLWYTLYINPSNFKWIFSNLILLTIFRNNISNRDLICKILKILTSNLKLTILPVWDHFACCQFVCARRIIMWWKSLSWNHQALRMSL